MELAGVRLALALLTLFGIRTGAVIPSLDVENLEIDMENTIDYLNTPMRAFSDDVGLPQPSNSYSYSMGSPKVASYEKDPDEEENSHADAYSFRAERPRRKMHHSGHLVRTVVPRNI
eukprot:912392-Amorphochlora_amoeboformis.AAC.1